MRERVKEGGVGGGVVEEELLSVCSNRSSRSRVALRDIWDFSAWIL